MCYDGGSFTLAKKVTIFRRFGSLQLLSSVITNEGSRNV